MRCFCGSFGLIPKPLRYFGSPYTAQSDGANNHEAKGIWRGIFQLNNGLVRQRENCCCRTGVATNML